jgi:hypothetical protein
VGKISAATHRGGHQIKKTVWIRASREEMTLCAQMAALPDEA